MFYKPRHVKSTITTITIEKKYKYMYSLDLVHLLMTVKYTLNNYIILITHLEN